MKDTFYFIVKHFLQLIKKCFPSNHPLAKVVNRNKLKLVNRDLIWDDIRPRPVKNSRKSVVAQPDAQLGFNLGAEQNTEEPEAEQAEPQASTSADAETNTPATTFTHRYPMRY